MYLDHLIMKKFVFIFAMAMLAFGNVSAQSLYKTVRDTATKIVNNPNSRQDEIDIAQFEITVLNYIAAQVSKRGLQKTGYFYDSQAVNMKSFVDDCRLYALKANKISASKKKQVMECFREASLNNPLFNDSDKKNVHIYVKDAKSETPFSLDTDWEKAYDQATKTIKSIIK